TASSTMLTFLLEINGKRTSFRNNDELHHTAWENFKQNGFEKVRLTHEFFSFTQVRHPFTRLVSCYCGKVLEKRFAFVLMFNKFRRRRHQRTPDVVRQELPRYRFSRSASQPLSDEDGSGFLKIIPPAGKEEFMAQKGNEQQLPVERMPSFREFALNAAVEILACGTNRTCRTQVHASYGRQVDHCDPCEWHFDFIMKIETMKYDFLMLRRLVGETRSPQYDLPNTPTPRVSEETVVNGHISECKTTSEYLHQLTSEEIDLIYTAYHEDFLLFGYEPFMFN
ncbi:Sulfotransferase, partial [Trinorchestia longiramus]